MGPDRRSAPSVAAIELLAARSVASLLASRSPLASSHPGVTRLVLCARVACTSLCHYLAARVAAAPGFWPRTSWCGRAGRLAAGKFHAAVRRVARDPCSLSTQHRLTALRPSSSFASSCALCCFCGDPPLAPAVPVSGPPSPPHTSSFLFLPRSPPPPPLPPWPN